MKVLVTVDDIGMSRKINEAALELLQRGVVGCISIMPTGPAFSSAVEMFSGTDAAVSVHLNCIQPPFLTGVRFPSSHLAWLLLGRAYAGRTVPEWREQLEKVLSAGLKVSRLDSHQHLHNARGLRKVILNLAGEYGIPWIRAAVLPDREFSLRSRILDGMGRKLASQAEENKVRTNDLMLGFSCSGGVTRDYIEKYQKHLHGKGTAELVMHPSMEPVWTRSQVDEYRLMKSSWFGKWTEEHC